MRDPAIAWGWAEEADDDDAIVREVRAGAFARFEVLVRRHAGHVHRTVRAVLRSDRDVEDAVQQAFLQAFVGLRTFAGTASFSTWVTRIALNEALMRVRRGRHEVAPPLGMLEAVPSPDARPDDAAASREAVRRVQRAVGRLPPWHRELFRLRHVEGLSLGQAAARLGISESAAKLRLHRVRATLRAALRDSSPNAPAGGFARRSGPGCSVGGGDG